MKRIPRGLCLLLVLACSGPLSAQPKEARNIHFPTPFRHVVVIFQVTVIHAALPRRRASTTFPQRGGSINIRPPG
jgi:hypothetical protein